jgi:hypothetical protein
LEPAADASTQPPEVLNMIRFSCPHCLAPLKVKDERAGRRANCPKCGAPITVPEALSLDDELPATGRGLFPDDGKPDSASPASATVGAAGPGVSQPPQPAAQPASPERAARPEPSPAVSQGLVLQLYDLLRGEPVFVDWYLKTWHARDGRWDRSELPRSAFWSRWGVAIAISWVLAFTGAGLAVTIPFNAYALWKYFGDQWRYKEWRRRVDSVAEQIGLGDAHALIEQAPKVEGFKQFFRYATALLMVPLPGDGSSQWGADE